MSCDHCEAAVIDEVSVLPGVDTVAVDLVTSGSKCADAIDDFAIRAAIAEAGYEAT
jgi:copper chaperone CopZ